ncbi:unnamed protein product [Arctogadus glacialis]
MVGESRRWSWRPLAMWMPMLLLWITCFPPMAPGVAGTSGGVRTGSHVMPGRLGDGRALLSRAKRGWVWNQMFVLEEFSGPDPILVGRGGERCSSGRSAVCVSDTEGLEEALRGRVVTTASSLPPTPTLTSAFTPALTPALTPTLTPSLKSPLPLLSPPPSTPTAGRGKAGEGRGRAGEGRGKGGGRAGGREGVRVEERAYLLEQSQRDSCESLSLRCSLRKRHAALERIGGLGTQAWRASGGLCSRHDGAVRSGRGAGGTGNP